MPPSSQIRPAAAVRYAIGDVIAGKYRLEGVLGEGGMGTVWQAVNLQLEAPVAIKLIRAEIDREILTQRLTQEARATAKLGHPGIVRIFDVGQSEQGDAFIVMELLQGSSLARLLSTESRLSAVRAVQLLLPVADALSAVHSKAIIHRDLKPDNIFLAAYEDQIQPKLVDFGIVKMTGQDTFDKHLTQAGSVLGSPEYMSPEQARGRDDLDHRTDIWSFAVVLYEVLSGQTPFTGTSYNALLRSIVEDEPASLLDYLACDEALWSIVRRGLEKRPEARYPSMNEFGRALATWLFQQGIREDACGASLESKWLHRNSNPGIGRASFASLSGVIPESGVRGATNGGMEAAPTVGLPIAPQAHAENRRAAPPIARLMIVAAVALVLLGGVFLALRERKPELEISRAPAAAPAPTPTATSNSQVTTAPSAEASASARALAPAMSEPRAATPSFRAKHGARTAPAAPHTGDAPTPAKDATKKSEHAPNNDLLVPY